MKNALPLASALVALLVILAPAQAQTNTLAGFGTGDFNVDPDSASISYLQTATSLNFTNSAIAFGNTLGGVWTNMHRF